MFDNIHNAVLRLYDTECLHAGPAFAVKDNIGVKGEPLTLGLKPPALEKCADDAEIVRYFKSRGARLRASCNMDELALGSRGENRFFGAVVNPRDENLTAGGSSGGCAACVAGGLCDFAIASDSGGSARIPAACCGITALKFSPQTFSKEGTLLLEDSVDCFGIMTRLPEDAAVICGADGENFSLDRAEILLAGWDGLSFHAEFDTFAEELPWHEALELRKHIMAREIARQIERYGIPSGALPPEARALIVLHAENSASPDRVEERRRELTRAMHAAVSDSRFLLTPVLPGGVPRRGEPDKAPLNLFLCLANVAGLPAIAFPLEGIEGGSVQIIGASGSDLELPLVAAEVRNSLKNWRVASNSPGY